MQTEEFAFESLAWSVSNSPKRTAHPFLRVIYASTSAGVLNVLALQQQANCRFQTEIQMSLCSARIGVIAPVT